MGNISNFESNEVGKERLGTLRRYGGDAKKIVDMMYQLSSGYEAFRSGLDPEADAGDIVYSDSAFDFSVSECLPVLEMMTDEQKVWLDRYLDGLGYEPKA